MSAWKVTVRKPFYNPFNWLGGNYDEQKHTFFMDFHELLALKDVLSAQGILFDKVENIELSKEYFRSNNFIDADGNKTFITLSNERCGSIPLEMPKTALKSDFDRSKL